MPRHQTSDKLSQRARAPSYIDAYAAERLRARRIVRELSQKDLARRVGLTFQQIQKYEYGLNRISAGHLYAFACALGCSTDYFFKGLSRADDAAVPPTAPEDLQGAHSTELWRTLATMDPQTRNAFLHFMTLQRPN